MNYLTVIMILGAFAVCTFMQASDNKKACKRIKALEEKVFPAEDPSDEKSN